MPRVKYTKEQRLVIGEQIYKGELSRFDAAAKYDIDVTTARDYMRMYRDAHSLPPKNTVVAKRLAGLGVHIPPAIIERYGNMSRGELLAEIFHLSREVESLQQGHAS